MAEPLFKEERKESASANPAANSPKGHRQRLRERFLKGGADALADYELLEMILFMAMPRIDTKPMAKALLAQFKTFANVISAEPNELKNVKGIGDSAVAALKVIHVGSLRLKKGKLEKRPVLSSWHALMDYLESSLKYKKHEEMRVLFLDRKNGLISDELQQKGTVDQVQIYPREIIKHALDIGASGLILVHNHPSGDCAPSPQDMEITAHLAKTAESMGITLHDHVIFGHDTYASFKTMGML